MKTNWLPAVLILFLMMGCLSPYLENPLTNATIDLNDTQSANPVFADLNEVTVLETLVTNPDFNDWRADFVATHKTQPDLKIVKSIRLSEEKKQSMINASTVGTKGVIEQILADLPLRSSHSIFYVEMKDLHNPSKGVIVIFDAQEKKVLKFFATLGLTS